MTWKQCTDEELLLAYAQGQFQGFDEFFKRHHKKIFYFILSKSGDHSESEDILQDTFFRIHRYIHTFRKDKKALSWVFTIAKNSFISSRTSNKKNLEHLEPVNSHHLHNQIEARESLINIFKQLPEDEQTLMIDRFINTEGYELISHKYKLTPDNTRKKISRILKKIRLNPSQ